MDPIANPFAPGAGSRPHSLSRSQRIPGDPARYRAPWCTPTPWTTRAEHDASRIFECLLAQTVILDRIGRPCQEAAGVPDGTDRVPRERRP